MDLSGLIVGGRPWPRTQSFTCSLLHMYIRPRRAYFGGRWLLIGGRLPDFFFRLVVISVIQTASKSIGRCNIWKNITFYLDTLPRAHIEIRQYGQILKKRTKFNLF